MRKKYLSILLSVCMVLTFMPIGGVTAFADEDYTITFDSNGGSEVEAQTGETITVPAMPTYEGYNFGGWYDDITFNTPSNLKPGAVDVSVTESKRVYARWTNEYGKTVVRTPLDFTAGVSPAIPAGTGISWNADEKILTLSSATIDCSAVTITFFAVSLPDGATLKLTDGTVNTIKGGSGKYGAAQDLASMALFGNSDGIASTIVSIIGNGTLNAYSKDIAGTTSEVVSVPIMFEGGCSIGAESDAPVVNAYAGNAANSIGSSASSWGIFRGTVLNGIVTLVGGNASSNSSSESYGGGYLIINGGKVHASGGASATSAGILIANVSGGEVYAIGKEATNSVGISIAQISRAWEKLSGSKVYATGQSYAVGMADFSGETGNVKGHKDSNIEIDSLTDATIDDGKIVIMSSDGAVKPKTLYFSIPPIVIFDSNGGSEVDAQIGDTITVPEAPTYEGYSFGGWYDDPAFNSPSGLTPRAENVPIAKTKTVYARWTNEYGKTVVRTPLDFFGEEVPTIPAGSGISWNAEDKILTLDGATIDCSSVTDCYFAVGLPSGAAIVLTDHTENVIRGGYGEDDGENLQSSAIDFDGDGTITGNGTLDAYSEDVSGNRKWVSSVPVYINYKDDLMIGDENCSPIINGYAGAATNTSESSGSFAYSNGFETVYVVNGAVYGYGGAASCSETAVSAGFCFAESSDGFVSGKGGEATGTTAGSFGIETLFWPTGGTISATGVTAAIEDARCDSADVGAMGHESPDMEIGDLEAATISDGYEVIISGSGIEAKTALIGFSYVKITPWNVDVAKGRAQSFSATYSSALSEEPGDLGNDVTWSLRGTYAAGTTISALGVLTVDANETASSIIVRATSNVNSLRYDEAVVTVTSRGGGGHGGGSTAPAIPATPTTNIVVNGNDEIGKVEINGNNATTVVEPSNLDTALNTAGNGSSVQVDIPTAEGTATAQLAVKSFENMADKEVILKVKSDNVSYDLPAVAIDTDKILQQLGADNAADVPVNVSITKLDAPAQENIKNQIETMGAKLVGAPIEFKVTASYGGKTLDVDKFDKMVQRVVEIPQDEAKRITTAIVVEQNGKQRHVPTEVFTKDGKWYARINSLTNSTYAFITNEAGFADADGKWYEDVVNEMASRMVINGKTATTFDGGARITRAEFASILVRALGLPGDGTADFTDVSDNAWYAGAVGTAVEYGLVDGYTDGSFKPNANITRAEAMVMMQRAAGIAEYSGKTGSLDSFEDAGSVAGWAKNAAAFNVGSGLIEGSDGNIRPKAQITRAECATVVMRLLQNSGLIDKRTEV